MSQSSLNLNLSSRMLILVLIAMVLVSACTSTADPTIEPTQEPTKNSNFTNSRPPVGLEPTATVPPPAYREPSAQIKLDNVTQIEYLGRLDTLGRKSTIFNWAISPDGVQLVALNNDLLTEWNLVTGLMNFATSRLEVTNLFYSADKTEIYAIQPSSKTYIYRSITGESSTTLTLHDNYNGVMAYDPGHGWTAVAGTDQTVKVWDLKKRESLVTFPAHEEPLVGLAFSSNGTYLATTATDGKIKLWDWQAENEVAEFDLQNTIAITMTFSPNDSQLAVSTKNYVALWDVATSDLDFVLQTGEGAVNEILKYSPDGKYLATAGATGNMRLWNSENSNLEIELPNVGGNRVSATFSPDSTLLATTILGENASLWNLTDRTDKTVARAPLDIESGNLFSVEWSSDGYTLLFIDASGEIYVWGIPAKSE